MGKLTNTAQDLADRVSEGDLAIVGDATPWIELRGVFNLTLTGVFVGTVVLDRSFDGGTNFAPAGQLAAPVNYTVPVSEELESLEPGVLHRLRRTVATNGSVHARLSQ